MKTPLNAIDIYTTLKTAIVNLDYMPSTKLSENEIAKKYNLSRTPVKAAFTRLENEGFLVVLPQRGTFVSLLNLENIKETVYMRFILEKEIAHTFINTAKEKDLHELERILHKQKEIIENDNFTAFHFYGLDSAFHGFMFEKTGHAVLWDELLKLQVHYTRFRMLDIVSTHKFDTLLNEHRKLFNAIEKEDATLYGTLLEEHLQGNLKKLETCMESDLKHYFDGGNK